MIHLVSEDYTIDLLQQNAAGGSRLITLYKYETREVG